jgi:hypothetical protein
MKIPTIKKNIFPLIDGAFMIVNAKYNAKIAIAPQI